MLIWTNFDSFATKYVIKVDYFKDLIFQQRLSLETQKGLELVFRKQFLKNFSMKLLPLEYDINWPNLIKRLCLLPKLFSKFYLFYAQAFDDI